MSAPPALVRATFLGRDVGGGVTAPFRDRLASVEAALREQHAREARDVDFVAWCGLYGVGGFRPAPSGFHGHGVAVDLNYATNGYTATRTPDAQGRATYGGEAAGHALDVRRPAMEAYDRACVAFDGQPADLAARKHGETTGAAWDRFHRVSEAVRGYFAPYFPARDRLDVGEADILPGVDPANIPAQVRADYDAIRVPLCIGAPSAHPRTMRNPARGIMDLPRHVAVAMCDVGRLRWGAVDFGAAESGDVMHFDAPGLA